jgi:hypothetical protein
MVSVTFMNPNTNASLPVDELDEQMTVREAVENLVEHNFIPPAGNGQHYALQIKGKTELTNADATLASGGLATGDVIFVARQQRGGC